MSDYSTPKRPKPLKFTPITTAQQTPMQSLSPNTRSRVEIQNQLNGNLFNPPPSISHHWLYQKTLDDLTKIHTLQSKLNKSVNTQRIDRALSRHLKRQEEKSEFKRKFQFREDKRMKGKRHSVMSETRMEQDRMLLRELMNNPEDRGKIYQNSLLQEYYLKDLEKNRTNIQYLKKDFAIVKHRKLTDNSKQNQSLHLMHDQGEVDHVRLLNYVKHEKQIQQAVKRAKKNITYRKSLNLQRINYLIQCMVARPLVQNPVRYPPEITPAHRFILRKLFFRYSNFQGPETTLYTHITMQRLDTLFQRLSLPPSVPPHFHRDLFNKIVKYKNQKVLFYYDFIEVLAKTAMMIWPTLNPMHAMADLLFKFVKDRKDMYISYLEVMLDYYWKDIDGYAEKSKIKYCLESIFWSETDKLEYGMIITMASVSEALTNFGLIEAIQRQKVMFYCKYMCGREEGMTLQQFVRSIYLIALSQQMQLYKVKADHMKRITQGQIAKNDPTEIIGFLNHYFFDKLKLLSKVIV